MKKIGFVLLIAGIMIMVWFGYGQWKAVQSAHTLNENVSKAFDKGTKPKADGGANSQAAGQEPPPVPHYKTGERVARLFIPKIKESYNVFWGTDKKTLEKGAGMYVSRWTVPPGYGGHTVISGHRDTVFRPLKDLKKGDMVYVNYKGVDYQYEIKKIWITNADDRTVIVKKDKPTLTLTTCYPFYYVGNAPDRYIIQGELVKKGDLLKDHSLK